jgi:predicted nucleic acid-binding protein
MPDKVVLDSNITAAMFFKEDASRRALEAVAGCDAITLDYASAEVGNVAWKQAVQSGENKEVALKALKKCLSFISEVCDIVRSQELVGDAYEIAVENKIAIYDSLFLAAAEREHVPLLTLDKKLYERMKARADVRLI